MTRTVICVSYSLELGGTQRLSVFLTKAFASAGWKPVVFLCAHRPRHFSLPDACAVVEGWRAKSRALRALGFAGRSMALVASLRRTVRTSRPDLIIALGNSPSVLAVLASLGSGVPVIVSDRCAPSQDPLERGPWRAAVRLLYPRAARVVAVSEGIARERAWLRPGQVVVIPNAVQLTAAGPAADDPRLDPPSAPHLMALGRLHPKKGFDVLIDAFARLAGCFPAWHLTVIGEGPERPSLEAQVAGLGLAGRVHLPGAAKDPAALLRAAAAVGGVFAFPSRSEGFPNALIEAMASGLPVVAADCPHGPREILEGGAHGVLVPPENVVALAEALAALMADPARRASLASAAVARAKTYAPDRIAPLWLNLADQVVAEHRRRG